MHESYRIIIFNPSNGFQDSLYEYTPMVNFKFEYMELENIQSTNMQPKRSEKEQIGVSFLILSLIKKIRKLKYVKIIEFNLKAYANLFYYLFKLRCFTENQIVIKLRLQHITSHFLVQDLSGKSFYSNPSVLADHSSTKYFLRVTNNAFYPAADKFGNWRIDGDGQDIKNGLLKLVVDEVDKKKTFSTVIDMEGPPCLEDSRVFISENKEFVVSTLVESSRITGGSWKSSVGIFDLESKVFYVIPSPFGKRIEKNWIPFESNKRDGYIYLIYQSDPLCIIKLNLKNKKLNLLHGPPSNKPRLNGGSQAVLLNNGNYIRVARRKYAWPNYGWIYFNYFVLHNPNFEEISRSKPFIFEQLGIEICNGLALNGGDLILSWAQNERMVYTSKIPLNCVLSDFENMAQN